MTEDEARRALAELKRRARDGELSRLERWAYRALLLAVRRHPDSPGGETRAATGG